MITPVTILTINRKESVLKQEKNGIRICSEENACSFVYNSLIDDYNYMENSVMYTDDFYDSQVTRIVMEEDKLSQIIVNPLQVYEKTIDEYAIIPDHQFQFQVFMSFQDEYVLPITIRMTGCPDYNYELERLSSDNYSYMKMFKEIGYFDLGYQSYLNRVKNHVPSKKIVLSSKNRRFYR